MSIRRTITLTLASGLLATPVSLAAQAPLTTGTPVAGTLAPSDTTQTPGQVAKLIAVDVPPGTRLKVTLESEDFDAYLGLVEIADGEILRFLTENDDYPGLSAPTDAMARYVPESGMDYAAWVGSYDGTGIGDFTLTAAVAPAGELFPHTLETGRWVEEALDGDDATTDDGVPLEVFEFTTSGVDRIMALAEGEASPTLRLVDPSSGEALAEAEAENGTTFLDWVTPAEGAYRLEVTPAEGRTGRFALRAWRPPVTPAELDGLRLDSLVHHPEYGFRFPAPGDELVPVRGLQKPHNRYRDGFTRIWYLAGAEDTLVAVLYASYFGSLTDARFDELVGNFAQGFGQGGETRPKTDHDRSVRMVIPNGGQMIRLRCIGDAAETRAPGEALCVAVIGSSDATVAVRLLDELTLR